MVTISLGSISTLLYTCASSLAIVLKPSHDQSFSKQYVLIWGVKGIPPPPSVQEQSNSHKDIANLYVVMQSNTSAQLF